MSDLKARLREREHRVPAESDGRGGYYYATKSDALCQEAADRIAALEEKLRVAREGLGRIAKPEYGLGFNKLRGIARTTLQSIGDEDDEFG